MTNHVPAPPSWAQLCLSVVATREEREDRLGDLEEAFRLDGQRCGLGVARKQYARDAVMCALLILRRRIAGSVSDGGRDMIRVFLWASVSVAAIFFFYGVAGGEASAYVQPFEWLIIVAAVLGSSAAGGRLGAWKTILKDLRRADRLMSRRAAQGRKTLAEELGRSIDQPADASTFPIVTDTDFKHLSIMVQLAATCAPSGIDRLMTGHIEMFRNGRNTRLRVVAQTVSDTYAGSLIAFVLGVIYTMSDLAQPVEALGHLLAGATCALFFGIVAARSVVAPIASRLSDLYDEEVRELEALRLSISSSRKGADCVGAQGLELSVRAFTTLLSPG